MARDQNGFTPIEAAIARVLEDGKWHSRKELLVCIDTEADRHNLKTHIYNMRQILRGRSEIISMRAGRTGVLYRLCLRQSQEND